MHPQQGMCQFLAVGPTLFAPALNSQDPLGTLGARQHVSTAQICLTGCTFNTSGLKSSLALTQASLEFLLHFLSVRVMHKSH